MTMPSRRSYKVLGLLLTYPTPDLIAAARSGELQSVLAGERLIDAAGRAAIEGLIESLATGDPLDLEERYVYIFDRSRSRSLHLFEHVHGDSRDRGQAMLDLMEMYDGAGLELAAGELPDFLPAFLEYLALLPDAEARQRLSQPIHIIAAIGRRLAERQSPYAAVFTALERLAAEKPDEDDLASLLEEADDDPDDGASIDAAWEEQPVDFGPSSPGFNEAPCERMSRAVDRMLPADAGAPDASPASSRF